MAGQVSSAGWDRLLLAGQWWSADGWLGNNGLLAGTDCCWLGNCGLLAGTYYGDELQKWADSLKSPRASVKTGWVREY